MVFVDFLVVHADPGLANHYYQLQRWRRLGASLTSKNPYLDWMSYWLTGWFLFAWRDSGSQRSEQG
jgi:hypothetical protein